MKLNKRFGLRPTGPDGAFRRRDYLRGLGHFFVAEVTLLPLVLFVPRWGSTNPWEYFAMHLFIGFSAVLGVLALGLLASFVLGRPGPARALRLLAEEPAGG